MALEYLLCVDITVNLGAWSNGETTQDLNDIPAGTYSVQVVDENNCPIDIEVEITQTEETIAVTQTTLSDYNGFGVSCNGESDLSISQPPEELSIYL